MTWFSTTEMRPGERVFMCLLHGYQVRSWRRTVCCSSGRIPGCERCASVFALALDEIGFA